MGFDIIDVEIAGESHADKMTLKLSGIEQGSEFSARSIKNMLNRRKSGAPWTTPRIEADEPSFLSGIEGIIGETALEDGKNYRANGDVITAYVKNTNVKKADYNSIRLVPRPSHADFVQYVKDGKIATGGGRFSGRLTTMLCVAGGIAEDILRSEGIEVVAYVSSIGEKELGSYLGGVDVNGLDKSQIERIKNSNFPLLDESEREETVEYIKQISEDGDSVGGTIECAIFGVKAGSLGENLFAGLEGKIAYSVFGVPAVKGVEFGLGAGLAKRKGSEANDALILSGGEVKTKTNNSGGINGGIANGMPITLRVAIRPTPSIAKEQNSVNLEKKEECKLSVHGRHDACIVPRAVPCVESAVALALLDEFMLHKVTNGILNC